MSNTLKFKGINELENYISQTFFNKDDEVKNMVFTLPHSTEYKLFTKSLIEQQTKGKILWEVIFRTELSGDWEYSEPTIRITYTDRYIKAKDRLIFKQLESVETY